MSTARDTYDNSVARAIAERDAHDSVEKARLDGIERERTQQLADERQAYAAARLQAQAATKEHEERCRALRAALVDIATTSTAAALAALRTDDTEVAIEVALRAAAVNLILPLVTQLESERPRVQDFLKK